MAVNKQIFTKLIFVDNIKNKKQLVFQDHYTE